MAPGAQAASWNHETAWIKRQDRSLDSFNGAAVISVLDCLSSVFSFGTSLVVQWSRNCTWTAGARVPSLPGELRSHLPHRVVKTIEKKNLFHDRKISCLFMLLLATKSAQMFFLMHHTHFKLNQCYRWGNQDPQRLSRWQVELGSLVPEPVFLLCARHHSKPINISNPHRKLRRQLLLIIIPPICERRNRHGKVQRYHRSQWGRWSQVRGRYLILGFVANTLQYSLPQRAASVQWTNISHLVTWFMAMYTELTLT